MSGNLKQQLTFLMPQRKRETKSIQTVKFPEVFLTTSLLPYKYLEIFPNGVNENQGIDSTFVWVVI